MKEWLTVAELSDELGCNPKWPSKILNKGEIPQQYYKRINGKQLLFHCSAIPMLREKYTKRCAWIYEKNITVPEDAVDYDGYLLTPSEIARLEEVRRNNDYRASHYTNLSLTELIAMGGDKQNYAFN